MSVRDEELKAARYAIDATCEVDQIHFDVPSRIKAAELRVDLWAALHKHGAYEDNMRDVVSISRLAIYTVLAVNRTEATLAAITDGPYAPPMTGTVRHLRIPEPAGSHI